MWAPASAHPDSILGRRTAWRPRTSVAAAALLLLATAACRDDPGTTAPSALGDGAITVGSFDFTESIVVAEIYSQALESAGYEVERAFGLGPREFVAPALTAGLVELVPEYAGTAAEFHSLGRARPTGDVATTHDELVRAVADQPVVVLAAAPAQDANTFVVTRETARRLHLEALTDLAAVGGQLTLGAPAECPNRDLCLAGLTDVYGVRFADFLALDAGGPLTLQALEAGHIDVALMFTTDPAIAGRDLVALTDDRGLQPAENITPIMRSEVVERWGSDVVAVIDAVSALLTTSTVRELNGAIVSDERDDDTAAASVAAAWWSEVSS